MDITNSISFEEATSVAYAQRTAGNLPEVGKEDGKVVSAYVRLLERERKKREEANTKIVSQRGSCTFEFSGSVAREDDICNTRKLSEPLAPLPVLARMRLAFDLHEWRHQMKRNPVLDFAGSYSYERNSKEEVAAMFRYKQQCAELQKNLSEARADDLSPDVGIRNKCTLTSLLSTSPPGMALADFERDIVEPFFDALFPPIVSQKQPQVEGFDALTWHGMGSDHMQFLSGNRNLSRLTYQRLNQSHVEAAENLFRTIDADGDGLVTWDELSTYILECGERSLVKGDASARRKRGKSGRTSPDEEREKSVDYVGRILDLTTVPANTTLWQKRYPLVRFLYHTEAISHIVFIDHGRRYVTAAWDGLVKLWRTDPRLANAQGKPAIVHERNLLAAGVPILDMSCSPQSLGNVEMLVVLTIDCSVTLVRAGTAEVVKTFLGRHSVPTLPVELQNGLPKTPSCLRGGTPEESLDLLCTVDVTQLQDEDPSRVMRPEYKVRAYRRDALDILFTDVSRYFTGLGIIAPTYEHLERPQPVKTDFLSRFGVCGASSLGYRSRPATRCERPRCGTREEVVTPETTQDTGNSLESTRWVHCGSRGDGHVFEGVGSERSNRKPTPGHCASDYTDEGVAWFSRCVALANYVKFSSTSLLPTGPLMLIGFSSGVLQFYPLRAHWFDVFGQTETRLEPPESHEPLLTLKLHRAAIVKIVVSVESDIVMTVSDDCTVGVRHLSRVEVPFMTLGETVAPTGAVKLGSTGSTSLWLSQNHGHRKRITCATFHAGRAILVTGSLDRTVIFWVPSSPRPLHRLELSEFRKSATSGYPVDVAFMQPPLRPLMLMAADSKRVLYFFDVDTYQCVCVVSDDSAASLRFGEMLCARYDAVQDRLILGGYYPRVWNPKQTDDYPAGYLGHRKPVVNLVHQRKWDIWFSADEEVIIVWRPAVTEVRLGMRKAAVMFPPDTEQSQQPDESDPQLEESSASDANAHWKITTVVERSWVVDGGICCISVEQTESAHVFVALEHCRCIKEYNGLNGTLVRTFTFPSGVNELSSMACGVMEGKGTLRQSVSLLSATFEKERSLDGTTALYLLPGKSSESLSALGDNTIEAHRQIITDRVGVAAAIIYETLGIVIVGHRGGISTTPVDEVTKCPIPCTRLTDTSQHKSEGKRSIRASVSESFKRRFVGDKQQIHVSQRSSTTNALHSDSDSSDLDASARTSTRASSQKSSKFPATTDARDCQSVQTSCENTVVPAPLDLVALLPGPLVQDPVNYTREFMQKRERYLNCNEPTRVTAPSNPSNTHAENKYDVLLDDGSESVQRKSEELPPLLLFSRDFDEFLPASKRDCGFLLSEQFANLGFVSHIVPVGTTGYIVTGSDDGVIQIWNGRRRAEAFRFRVTYELDAITAMEVSRDGVYIAVSDHRGHMALLDVSNINWTISSPWETEGSMHEGVILLRRWRAHKNNLTAVRFIRKTSFLASTTSEAELSPFPAESLTEASKGEGQSVRVNTFNATAPFVDRHTAVFLCASCDDGYVYVWSVLVPSVSFGNPSECTVSCIGYFGGNSEVPPKMPSLKHNPCSFEVLDVVRKEYVQKRLFPCVRELFDNRQVEAAITRAAEIVKEDMLGVRFRGGLPSAPHGALLFGTRTMSRIGLKRSGDISPRASIFWSDQSTKTDMQQGSGSGYPPSYALAFRDEFHGEHDLPALLKRLFDEVVGREFKTHVPSPISRKDSALISPHRGVFARRRTRTDTICETPREGYGVTVLHSIPQAPALREESAALSDTFSAAHRIAEAAFSCNPAFGPAGIAPVVPSMLATPLVLPNRGSSIFASEEKEKQSPVVCVPQVPRKAMSSSTERSGRDTGTTVVNMPPNCNLPPSSVYLGLLAETVDAWVLQPEIVVRGATCAPLPRRRCSPAAGTHKSQAKKGGSPRGGSPVKNEFSFNAVPSSKAIRDHVEREKWRGVMTLLGPGSDDGSSSGRKGLQPIRGQMPSPFPVASSDHPRTRTYSSCFTVGGASTSSSKKPKRKSEQEERLRVMKTLMSWNTCPVPKVTGGKGIVSTVRPPNCKPVYEGSLLSYSDSSVASMTLPALIPPFMNVTRNVRIPSIDTSPQVKSLMTVLEEEKDVMTAVLTAALQEKEQLLLRSNTNPSKLPAIQRAQSIMGGHM
ncbi:WD domain [Trypanosoma brucei equiperdum]|uniref:WD domain n=1 Tax=Trypanosoma brucei equiperdum TaxID=630700 RepID=A0A3L6KXL2_9TRYP|nr:WD domain [Trypanosoma brucei equiperdum]